MPSPDEILRGLEAAARGALPVAVAWHVLLGAFLLGLLGGWRPSRRLVGAGTALPMFSVSALAWSVGNPFNGLVFGALGLILLVLGARLASGSVRVGPPWSAAVGGALVAFGWVYPHFADVQHWSEWLIAAPLGLVPCPTLAATVGVVLLLGGLGGRGLSLVLAGAALLYGLFGALRLGVTMDAALVVGAAALAVRAFQTPPSRRRKVSSE